MGYAGPGRLGGGLEWGGRLDPSAPGQTATPQHPLLLCLPRACCVTPGQATLSELPRTHSQPLPLSAGHVVNTNCSAAHSRQALCCKMAVEYDRFIESGRK